MIKRYKRTKRLTLSHPTTVIVGMVLLCVAVTWMMVSVLRTQQRAFEMVRRDAQNEHRIMPPHNPFLDAAFPITWLCATYGMCGWAIIDVVRRSRARNAEELARVCDAEPPLAMHDSARIRALADEFKTIAARRKRLSRQLQFANYGVIALVFLLAQYLIWHMPTNHWSVFALQGIQMLVPFAFFFPVIRLSYRSRRQQAIAEELAHGADVAAIGPLLQCLGIGNRSTQRAIGATLVHLLRAVREEDAEHFSGDDLRLLTSLLKPTAECYYRGSVGAPWESLLLAALHAIAEVGDASAIPAVLDLATRSPDTDEEERITRAADRCLQRLRTRVEQQTARRNLLVPSDAPANANARLVRPSAGAETSDPAALVRPTTAETIESSAVAPFTPPAATAQNDADSATVENRI